MTSIKTAGPDDVGELTLFAADSYTRTFGHLYDPADLSLFLAGWNPPERLHTQLADPAWAIALARSDSGEIAGFVKLGPIDFDLPAGQPHDKATQLHQLYVGEAAKGTGIAAALTDWGIAWASERAAILYLSVFTENHRAQAFYRRYGFVDVGRHAFRVGNHVDEDRIWRLDL